MTSKSKVWFCALVIALCSSCTDTAAPVPSVTPESEEAYVRAQLVLGGARDRLPPATSLILFVRKAGERMPLAVARYTLKDAPPSLDFATPADVGLVEVVARISLSGRVERQPEDVEAVVRTTPAVPAAKVVLEPQIEVPEQPDALTFHVSLEADLDFPPAARVFLIARDAGATIPVAVRSVSPSELPGTFRLDQTHAMLPTRTIATSRNIQVAARLSMSGSADGAVVDWLASGTRRADRNDVFDIVLKPPAP